jgi:serine/threonine-protein kinase
MDRVVAIKVIAPELIESERARKLFQREVLALTSLSHPNIAIAHDADEIGGQLFLVMEYVAGKSLEDVVATEGPQPIGIACEMMRQACSALQYAHERGVVHRDIKPANLLVMRSPEGIPTVKIVDFGLARLHTSAKAGTLMSQNNAAFLGTPDYVAPEQARNAHEVDIRSDLYSLGCSFYYALSGRKPFDGATVVEIICKHLNEEPPPLEKERPEIPSGVVTIVKKLMAKDPARRFQTPKELAAELAYWRSQAPKEFRLSRPVATLNPSATAVGASMFAKPATTGQTPVPAPLNRALQATNFIPAIALGGAATIPAAPDVTPSDIAVAETVSPPPMPVSDASQKRSPSRPAPRVESRPPVVPEALPRESAIAVLDEKLASESVPLQEEAPAPAVVSAPGRSAAELSPTLARWLRLVQRFADAEQSVEDLRDYRAVHVRLLESCRAESSGDSERAKRVVRLEEIARPWLSTEALVAADRPTLDCVLRQSRQLERELGVRKDYTLAGILTFLALVGIIVAAAWGYSQLHASVVRARLTPDSLWSVVESHPIPTLIMVVPTFILVIFGFVKFWRN